MNEHQTDFSKNEPATDGFGIQEGVLGFMSKIGQVARKISYGIE